MKPSKSHIAMPDQTDIQNQIVDLFAQLGKESQVSCLTTLYYKMYDGQKDRFLEEIEND